MSKHSPEDSTGSYNVINQVDTAALEARLQAKYGPDFLLARKGFQFRADQLDVDESVEAVLMGTIAQQQRIEQIKVVRDETKTVLALGSTVLSREVLEPVAGLMVALVNASLEALGPVRLDTPADYSSES